MKIIPIQAMEKKNKPIEICKQYNSYYEILHTVHNTVMAHKRTRKFYFCEI